MVISNRCKRIRRKRAAKRCVHRGKKHQNDCRQGQYWRRGYVIRHGPNAGKRVAGCWVHKPKKGRHKSQHRTRQIRRNREEREEAKDIQENQAFSQIPMNDLLPYTDIQTSQRRHRVPAARAIIPLGGMFMDEQPPAVAR